MSGKDRPNLFTIPASHGFVDTLATGLLERAAGDPQALSRCRILLPTRRACRSLREAILRKTGGEPLLLPAMQPLGDIDDDELMIKLAGVDALDIPPAISSLQRQILLARFIRALPDFKVGADQAMHLSKALGRFMDQVLIEGLSLDYLHTIVPEDFAEHWQITVDFLKILSENWPRILEENGVIDAADRRNRLVLALNDLWLKNPPQTPVIAAGSTGTVPATRKLLKTIASMPNGSVILPGLDTAIDQQSWQALDDSHPQHSLKVLLESFDLTPSDIPLWPYASKDVQNDRAPLLREIMRPAETAGQWARINAKEIKPCLENLEYYPCETQQDEATLIALILRETLETPEKTAALITPDRALARRVSMICRKWGITLDDSGGRPLIETYRGSFLALTLHAAMNGCKPVSLLSVLKHGLFVIGKHSPKEQTALIYTLDKDYMRGNVAYSYIGELSLQHKNMPGNIKTFLDELDSAFRPLLTLKTMGKDDFSGWLKAHIQLTETLCGTDSAALWGEDDGEALSSMLSELLSLAHLFPPVTFQEYSDIIRQLLTEATVRPSYGTHPRLMILGQLEARLVQADTMILSGLNEGSWPPDIGHDPWMSRPMRKTYGLPSMDMRIGLSAHDFGQCFCADRVILTRSKRVDGAPGVPSRWLQRLDTVLKAVDMQLADLETGPYPYWTGLLKTAPETLKPFTRPAPCPPVDKRPVKLPVTAIESWMRDPYALYAKYILDLRKPDDLEEDMDAALRGTLVHDVFDRFIKEYRDSLPAESADILMAYTLEALGAKASEPGFWAYWRPRFARMIDWFLDHEKQWRKGAKVGQTETRGTYTLPDSGFIVTAKADRIDVLDTGDAAIIDYKTGGTPGAGEIRAGFAPQLPLEGLILQKGGYPDIPANDVGYMGFWKLSGGATAGDDITINPKKDETLQDFVTMAESGLAVLVKTFADEKTAYLSLPRPKAAPPAAFQDYAHLARVQEWAALDDSDGGDT